MSPIIQFLSNLRFRFFLAGRTLGYSEDYINILYTIFLGHHKVIHYRNGYPVYSLTTPALYSKPMAHFLARSMYRGIQNKNLPNFVTFAVDDRCNAGCEHCSFFEGINDRSKKVMSLNEAKKIIDEAQELGVSVFTFVGGEPLMRKELPDIIRHVNKDLSTTTVVTNGWLLKERAPELKAAGLDGVLVSIDASTAKKHDFFRKKEGLFDRAIEGIKEVKRLGMTTGFSTTMTPEFFKVGELQKIMELAKQVGVHEVAVLESMPTGRYKHRKDLIDKTDWIEELIAVVKKYNQDPNYPGIAAQSYITSHRSIGCACGTSYCYVSPYGDMMSCDFNHHIFGNVIKEPFYKIWEGMTSQALFHQSKWGGCKIKDSDCLDCGCVSAGE